MDFRADLKSLFSTGTAPGAAIRELQLYLARLDSLAHRIGGGQIWGGVRPHSGIRGMCTVSSGLIEPLCTLYSRSQSLSFLWFRTVLP